MMAEESARRSDRDSSRDLGEVWKYGCPKSPVWRDDGLEGGRSQDTSSMEYYEHDVHNLTIEVGGQDWSSEVISLFLEDWEVGRVARRLVSGPFVPGNEGCMQGELRVSGFSSLLVFGVPKKLSGGVVTAAKPFSHRGRAVTTREFGERYEGEGTCAASPFDSCRLASFLYIFGGGLGVPVERGAPSCRRVVLVVLREFSMR